MDNHFSSDTGNVIFWQQEAANAAANAQSYSNSDSFWQACAWQEEAAYCYRKARECLGAI